MAEIFVWPCLVRYLLLIDSSANAKNDKQQHFIGL